MAQTDARPGFRLPWSSDRQSTDTSDGDSRDERAVNAWPSEDSGYGATTPTADAVTETAAIDPWAGTTAPGGSPSPASGAPDPLRPARKPTKFMADLTRAMQAAADEARTLALSQLQADAKAHVESIHGRSATESANLRRAADDDVAAVREWSKAEIARIREETETRITDRKARLETEIEQHAGVIEREIDAVQKTVAEFEEEMTAFFERLLGEEDPTRFATMAENLPEPPTFEDIVAGPAPVETHEDVAETVIEPAADEAVEPEAVAADPAADAEPTTGQADGVTSEADAAAEETVAEGAAEAVVAEGAAEASADGASESAIGSAEGAFGGEGGDGEVDREAAFAAIQAAAEAAASAEVAADAAARAEAVADVAIEIIGNHEDEGEADPRFAALGLSPDYDAAEAEALAAAGTSDEEIPEIGDDALAARLAGLVPGKSGGDATDTAATQVVVVGLISVASIASFKRHLGRVPGVQSVGVSSGPDGEFVFAVTHGADIALRDAIPSLPSFQARVTGSSDGVVHVTAHDPEADA
jgi:hypothetical protein